MMRRFWEIMDDALNTTVVFGYDRVGYWVRQHLWNDADLRASMQGKTCVVTGANSGLGHATSMHLAGLGAEVYLLCRQAERGQQAREEIVQKTGNAQVFLEVVDMSDQSSIRSVAERLRHKLSRLDVLINNAGVLLDERQLSLDGIELTFATNTLGYFLLTHLLWPVLQQSAPSRVINVSSGGMYLAKLHVDDLQFAQRPYDGVQAYAESKRAEVLLTQLWARQWQGTGVAVQAMHPGWADTKGVQTSLPRFRKVTQSILRSPAQGADTMLWLALQPRLAEQESGQFWFDRKARPVHRQEKTRCTEAEIQKFWSICCELTGIQLELKNIAGIS